MAVAKYYCEDFKPGDTFPMGERAMDRDEMMAFARQFDPQPFHVDEAAAKRSMYGGLIASGWHTVAIVMRMMCDSYLNQSASLGSPGRTGFSQRTLSTPGEPRLADVRWLKPVRPGDTIRAQRAVLESRASQSRPEMGLVKTRWEVFN